MEVTGWLEDHSLDYVVTDSTWEINEEDNFTGHALYRLWIGTHDESLAFQIRLRWPVTFGVDNPPE